MNDVDIPAEWKQCAERIREDRRRIVLVLGASDRGKSTWCDYLARHLSSSGLAVGFVDADIGQKDVGPPATVSYSRVRGPGGLKEAGLADFYFVGAITPVGHFLELVVGTRRMLERAEEPFVIIDTTGLIDGPGRVLKAAQIESVEPDAIVGIERGDELGVVLSPHRHRCQFRLAASRRAVRKSPGLRRKAREQAFGAALRGSRHLRLPIGELVWQRSPLFVGTPYRDPRFLHAERTAEGVVAVSRAPVPPRAADLKVLPAGFERDLLCAVADAQGRALGLALLQQIDYQRAELEILTPVARKEIAVVQLGSVYLSPEGGEQRGRIRRGW
jgi:polynucleotide 5'-hydroxyl-kinase GRC3/NOL9